SDASYDGVFFLAVKTTGIFCKPSCRARKPKPENVLFFATTNEAIDAGFRPCKRCRPCDVEGTSPAWIAGLLKAVSAEPQSRWSNNDIRRLWIEPSRVRRYFRSHYGMTFQSFSRAKRMGIASEKIKRGGKVGRVATENGYGSESGFRDAFAKILGRSPRWQ